VLCPERRSLAHQRVRSLNNVMRSVVVDFLRHSRTERSGGAQLQVTLNFAALDNDQITEVLGVTDRAVRRDPEKAHLLVLDALL
jgi:hypothetical protein